MNGSLRARIRARSSRVAAVPTSRERPGAGSPAPVVLAAVALEVGLVQEHEAPGGHEPAFRMLADAARLLHSETDYSRVIDVAAQVVRKLVPADSLIVLEADSGLRVLRPIQVLDADAKEIYVHLFRYGEGVSGEVAVSREPALVEDTRRDPRARQIEGTPEEEAESLLSVPLVARNELKGVLNLYRSGPDRAPFEAHELELARRFGELAGLAMDNAQIRARLQSESVIDRLTGLYNHRHFQERLADELRRAQVTGRPVAMVLADVDGFRRVNEGQDHLAGDRVLTAVASLCRDAARPGDLVCRIGGDEFAVLMPATGADEAAQVADAIRTGFAESVPAFGVDLTISLGVAEGPGHGSDAGELLASANYALLQAKTAGHDRVSVYQAGEWSGVRAVPKGEARMVGHLRALQSVSSKLNRLQDVRHIADAILDELGDLVEYHNCRVHLLDQTGQTLLPVAFHGTLTEYEGETEEALVTPVGEGITGRVALTGESIYAADADNCEFAQHIEGTKVIDESILAVPMKFDEQVIGTIVLSKLGLNQFDADDLRLLESLASSAAVAFENARLFADERQSAEAASSLLEISQVLTRTRDPDRVLDEVVRSIPDLLDLRRAAACVRQPDGSFTARSHVGFEPSELAKIRALRFPAEIAAGLLASTEEPFVVAPEVVATLPPAIRVTSEDLPVLVSPFTWEPDGLGVLVGWAADRSRAFGPRDFLMARGVADLASLAMGNAARFADLEHALLQTVEVLANALEAKDEYTSGHARQVAEVCRDARQGARGRGREPPDARARRDVPRHRQDRGGERDHEQARPAGRAGAGGDAAPLRDRRADPRAGGVPPAGPSRRPGRARAVGRAGLSRRAGKGADPARGQDHLRVRRVPRHDERPVVPPRPARRGGAAAAGGGRRDAVRSGRRPGVRAGVPGRADPGAGARALTRPGREPPGRAGLRCRPCRSPRVPRTDAGTPG